MSSLIRRHSLLWKITNAIKWVIFIIVCGIMAAFMVPGLYANNTIFQEALTLLGYLTFVYITYTLSSILMHYIRKFIVRHHKRK